MPQLDPTWYAAQLFWLAIILTFMHLMLKHVVLPRLMNVASVREETKTSAVAAAETFKREAEGTKGKVEQALADAKTRSQTALAEAQARIKAVEAEAQAAVDRTTAQRVADSSASLKLQMDQLTHHLQASAAELVGEVTARVTGTAPDAARVAQALKR